MEHLSNDHEDHPSQHENSHMSNAMKRGILFSLFQMKIIATVTKNSHQDRCPRYIHLWFFSFTHTLLYVLIMSRTSFRVNTLLFCGKIQNCCDSCFPWQIRAKTTIHWYILRDYSSVEIGFNINNKRHILPIVYTMLV